MISVKIEREYNVLLFKELCYKLYKAIWKSQHISLDRELKNIKDYYNYKCLLDEWEDYSYEEYVEEFGYNGEVYVCYDEFLKNEFLDTNFMHSLLREPKLIQKYKDYMVEKEDE